MFMVLFDLCMVLLILNSSIFGIEYNLWTSNCKSEVLISVVYHHHNPSTYLGLFKSSLQVKFT